MREVVQDAIEELLDSLQTKAREDIDPTFSGSFNIRTWLNSGSCRPSWVPAATGRVGGRMTTSPEFKALNARIKVEYDIAKTVFTKDMTVSKAKKVGERNKRVEHMTLTSPKISTKDALAFVWHRNRHAAYELTSKVHRNCDRH